MIFGKAHNLDFSEITDHIYLGNNMCCGIHFKSLQDLGISADVDLEETQLEKPEGIGVYLWLPVKDHTAPTKDQLDVGTKVIDDMVKAGKKVYVHCKNGHGRAPTLVAAYLVAQGKTPTEAVEFIKQKRPEIHLEGNQMEALEEFWTQLRSRK